MVGGVKFHKYNGNWEIVSFFSVSLFFRSLHSSLIWQVLDILSVCIFWTSKSIVVCHVKSKILFLKMTKKKVNNETYEHMFSFDNVLHRLLCGSQSSRNNLFLFIAMLLSTRLFFLFRRKLLKILIRWTQLFKIWVG